MRRRGSIVIHRRALAAVALAGVGLAALPGGAAPSRRAAGRIAAEQPSTDSNTAQEAYKFFQFGNQYYQQGLLQQAASALNQALAVQPVYPEAHYMLALVYRELKDPAMALAMAAEALRENPFFTECHNVMGLVYAETGAYEEALKEFTVVLGDVNFPTPEVAHFNIGKVFWEKKACGDAVIHFRKSLELNPSFGRAWYLMGDCQEAMDQRPQARESYQKAIALLPDEIGPMYRLGFICFQEGDFACARQWFDRVRLGAPTSEESAAAREYIRQMNFR